MTKLLNPILRRVPNLLAWVSGVLPPARIAVVFGQPSSEGNAVEVVRGLIDLGYRGIIIWLNAPAVAFPNLPRSRRVIKVQKSSVAALSAYLLAEAIFYTHALYGGPTLATSRVVVNLWHGDGPKRVDSPGHMSYLVAATEVYGRKHSQQFGLHAGQMLLVGNGRTDQFLIKSPAAALLALGLTPGQPFVVWMPTYRVAGNADSSIFREAIVDVIEPDGADGLTSTIELGLGVLQQYGITIVTRAHPLDAKVRHVPNGLTASDADLDSAGISLYQLLADASGLISDYSSVITDFLLLDRPIGIYAPDVQEYVEGRGLEPPESMSTLLPGQFLVDQDDFHLFAEEVIGLTSSGEVRRKAVREALGLVDLGGAAQRLLVCLADRNVLKLSSMHRP